MTVAAPAPAAGRGLAAGREAVEPAEARGRGRDDVRLLVGYRDSGDIRHLRFPDLPDVLSPGDLLVVNTSATLPASVPVVGPDGSRLVLHLSTMLPDHVWLVELRSASGSGTVPSGAGSPGEVLVMPAGAHVVLLDRYRGAHPHAPSRLWRARLRVPGDLRAYLAGQGRPIRYASVPHPWPIADYQTVFATEAGSAEMPSAGRAFTAELVTRLVSRGVAVAPIVLHAGVSSPEEGEAPPPEYYRVPAATARWANVARDAGSRVVAVGTTVVRALETAADDRGRVDPGQGWTDLVVGGSRGVGAVDGLLTGWHEPVASHLALVEAVAGGELLARCYREAAERGYLWHEFGDLCLILP